MIRVQNLQKVFASKTVLDGVTYSFAPDKTHIILGSSGSGKSTLLRLVLGLIEPTEGEIWIDSERMTPESRMKLTRQIGYVVQEGGLFPHLNCRDNIALVAKTLGWSPQKIGDRVTELCELAGLDMGLLQRLPRELSGGQRQRVGLIRALMLDPKILLLDEPLGALDPMIRSGLQQQLKNLFNRLRKTVLLVTHDLTEAAFLGDSILLMNDGKIVQTGSFSDLVNEPETSFVREFISAQRLLVPDEVERERRVA
jgi:osmoprotectant transport system ATP-binding protein